MFRAPCPVLRDCHPERSEGSAFACSVQGGATVRKAALMAAAVLLVVAGLAAQPAPPVHEIKMTAKKYEFNPEEIRVKQGERVRLLVTATDRKHGFQIEALGLKTELPEGKETAGEFTAA